MVAGRIAGSVAAALLGLIAAHVDVDVGASAGERVLIARDASSGALVVAVQILIQIFGATRLAGQRLAVSVSLGEPKRNSKCGVRAVVNGRNFDVVTISVEACALRTELCGVVLAVGS